MNGSDADPSSSQLAVVATNGTLRAEARQDFRAGEVILELQGWETHRASRFTIQLDDVTHLEMPKGIPWQVALDSYPWRFLNHNCLPNTRVKGRQLVALVEISKGTELSFDYDANELDMAEPFVCGCAHCGGRKVRGFAHLTPAEREARRPLLADYLLRHLDSMGSQGKIDPEPQVS